MGIRCADHVTPLYPQKLALTSPTGGGRSVCIVHSRTKATEFSLVNRLQGVFLLFVYDSVRNVALLSVYVGLRVKSTILFTVLVKLGICQQIPVKLPSTKFRAISFAISQDSTNRETSFPQIRPSLLQL